MLYCLLWLWCWYNDAALDVGLAVLCHICKDVTQKVKKPWWEQSKAVENAVLFRPRFTQVSKFSLIERLTLK